MLSVNWRTKAMIQNTVASLPKPLAQFCYYRIQRLVRRKWALEPHIEDACRLVDMVRLSQGNNLSDIRVMELGTGRRLNVPIVFWLLGAKQIFTVDANQYLRPELVAADIQSYQEQRKWITEMLSTRTLTTDDSLEKRFDQLLELSQCPSPTDLMKQLMELCHITYLAPADASDLDMENHSLSIHYSNNVLEHISEESLRSILKKASKLLKPGGLCVHHIDHSDHFAHSDPTISRINFLQFNDKQWDRYAGNHFMYMNRLRSSDFLRLFRECGFECQHIKTVVDDHGLKLIETGELPLAEEFQDRDITDLATTSTLIAAINQNKN